MKRKNRPLCQPPEPEPCKEFVDGGGLPSIETLFLVHWSKKPIVTDTEHYDYRTFDISVDGDTGYDYDNIYERELAETARPAAERALDHIEWINKTVRKEFDEQMIAYLEENGYDTPTYPIPSASALEGRYTVLTHRRVRSVMESPVIEWEEEKGCKRDCVTYHMPFHYFAPDWKLVNDRTMLNTKTAGMQFRCPQIPIPTDDLRKRCPEKPKMPDRYQPKPQIQVREAPEYKRSVLGALGDVFGWVLLFFTIFLTLFRFGLADGTAWQASLAAAMEKGFLLKVLCFIPHFLVDILNKVATFTKFEFLGFLGMALGNPFMMFVVFMSFCGSIILILRDRGRFSKRLEWKRLKRQEWADRQKFNQIEAYNKNMEYKRKAYPNSGEYLQDKAEYDRAMEKYLELRKVYDKEVAEYEAKCNEIRKRNAKIRKWYEGWYEACGKYASNVPCCIPLRHFGYDDANTRHHWIN